MVGLPAAWLPAVPLLSVHMSVDCIVVVFPLAPQLPDAPVEAGFGLQGQSVIKENERYMFEAM